MASWKGLSKTGRREEAARRWTVRKNTKLARKGADPAYTSRISIRLDLEEVDLVKSWLDSAKQKYLSPLGWRCTTRMADIVLTFYTALGE